jgi:hypothetical protein
VVRFIKIGGGNRRKPQTCRMSPTILHNVLSSTLRHEQDSNSHVSGDRHRLQGWI